MDVSVDVLSVCVMPALRLVCVCAVSAVRLVWMCEECQQLVLSQSRCGPCVVPTVSVEAGGQ